EVEGAGADDPRVEELEHERLGVAEDAELIHELLNHLEEHPEVLKDAPPYLQRALLGLQEGRDSGVGSHLESDLDPAGYRPASSNDVTGRPAGPESSANVAREAVDVPYQPRAIQAELEARHPGQLQSHTIAPNPRGRVLHPVKDILIDERGFPVFDDVAVFQTRLPDPVASVQNRRLHMQTATRLLN